MNLKEEIIKIIVTEPLKKLFWLIIAAIVGISLLVPKMSGWLQSRLSYTILLEVALSFLVLLLSAAIYTLYLRNKLKTYKTIEEISPSKSTGETLEPNIVCLGADDLFVTLDRHDVFREMPYPNLAIRSAAVKFQNVPIPSRKIGMVVLMNNGPDVRI
jgi:hypothetical protein